MSATQGDTMPSEPPRASRPSSVSSGTQVHDSVPALPVDPVEKAKFDAVPHGGEGESAFPEDKKVRTNIPACMRDSNLMCVV